MAGVERVGCGMDEICGFASLTRVVARRLGSDERRSSGSVSPVSESRPRSPVAGPSGFLHRFGVSAYEMQGLFITSAEVHTSYLSQSEPIRFFVPNCSGVDRMQ